MPVRIFPAPTCRELVLISLLGASAGLGILTTHLFHALLPVPGLGGLVFVPLGAACLVIARDRVQHPLAAGLTRTVQQALVFVLPGGPPWVHHPLLVPLMLVDGFLLDGVAWLAPRHWSRTWWTAGLSVAVTGAAGTLLQTGATLMLLGAGQGPLAQGVLPFLGLFVGLHSLLRFLGGAAGWTVTRTLPGHHR
jgi:hypothetical protein